jgi:hypothetical protein
MLQLEAARGTRRVMLRIAMGAAVTYTTLELSVFVVVLVLV